MAVPKLQYSSGNSASTTSSSPISHSDTSLPLASDTKFSAKSGEGMVIINEGTASEELAYATGKSGSSLTIPLANRGLEGTTAMGHASGTSVKGILTAGMWNGLIDAIKAEHDENGKHKFNAPEGFLLNGKIVPSVTSNNLTVAIKTLAGTDPSASNPVYVRLGDTVRSITSALSVTKNAGTNWCNAGSSELATQEVDYFVYLGYNATDGTVIGFSRIPYGTRYDSFSATTTNEKYCAISTITTAAAGDVYQNIGRFAATLSAGAGYTWTVPTFTSANLIQRPIYETRSLTWIPTMSGSGGSAGAFSLSVNRAVYKIVSDRNLFDVNLIITNKGSWSGIFELKLPIVCAASNVIPVYGTLVAQGSNPVTASRGFGWLGTTGQFNIMNAAGTAVLEWAGISNNDRLYANSAYEI